MVVTPRPLMNLPTRPTPHIILSSLVVYGTIVFLGSFHDVSEAIGLATIFVGFPWFAYYFLEWLYLSPEELSRRTSEQPPEDDWWFN